MRGNQIAGSDLEFSLKKKKKLQGSGKKWKVIIDVKINSRVEQKYSRNIADIKNLRKMNKKEKVFEC